MVKVAAYFRSFSCHGADRQAGADNRQHVGSVRQHRHPGILAMLAQGGVKRLLSAYEVRESQFLRLRRTDAFGDDKDRLPFLHLRPRDRQSGGHLVVNLVGRTLLLSSSAV